MLFIVTLTAIVTQPPVRLPADLETLDRTTTNRLIRDSEEQVKGFIDRYGETFDVEVGQSPMTRPNSTTRIYRRRPDGSLEILGGDDVENPSAPVMVDFDGAPLVGRVGTFNGKFARQVSAVDMVARQWSESEMLPKSAAALPEFAGAADKDRYLACFELRNGFSKLYPTPTGKSEAVLDAERAVQEAVQKCKDYEEEMDSRHPRRWPGHVRERYTRLENAVDAAKRELKQVKKDQGRGRSEHKKRLREMTHELRVLLPASERLPAKVKNRPEVQAYVYAVQYDRKNPFPVLTIHAVLVRSEDLGLDLTGRIE